MNASVSRADAMKASRVAGLASAASVSINSVDDNDGGDVVSRQSKYADGLTR